MRRLGAGPIIRAITNIFSNVSEKTNHSLATRKLTLLSAHDSTLAAVLNALGLYDPPKQTPYSSVIMFELHDKSNDSEGYAVRILFRNDSKKEPSALVLPGCKIFCPYGRFLEIVAPVNPSELEWKRECKVNSGTGGEMFDMNLFHWSAYAFLVLLVVVLAGANAMQRFNSSRRNTAA